MLIALAHSYRGCVRVTVGDGEKQESFDVHEALLTARSTFFKNALSGDWKEAEDRVVNLPDVEGAIFQLYIHLLYTDKLASIPESDSQRHIEYCRMAKLYVLGDRLMDITTKNVAIDALIQTAKEPTANGKSYAPGNMCIRIIYEGTQQNSLVRQLMIDFYVYGASGGWMLKATADKWPLDFLYDLTIALANTRKAPLSDPLRAIDVNCYYEKEPQK